MRQAEANEKNVLRIDSEGGEHRARIFSVHHSTHNGIGCLIMAGTRETESGGCEQLTIWVPRERIYPA